RVFANFARNDSLIVMRVTQRREGPQSRQRKLKRRSVMTNSNRSWTNALIFSGLCAVLSAAFAFQTSAQDSRSGQWIIDTTRGTNQYQLTLNYTSAKRGLGNNITSFSLAPDRLQGLTGAQIMSADSHVQFQLIRAAGTFNC